MDTAPGLLPEGPLITTLIITPVALPDLDYLVDFETSTSQPDYYFHCLITS